MNSRIIFLYRIFSPIYPPKQAQFFFFLIQNIKKHSIF